MCSKIIIIIVLKYRKLREAFNALDTTSSGELSMADVSQLFSKFEYIFMLKKSEKLFHFAGLYGIPNTHESGSLRGGS